MAERSGSSCSSLTPRSVVVGLARGIGEARKLLVAEGKERRRLGGVMAVNVDDHETALTVARRLTLEAASRWREEVLDRHRLGDDALGERGLDQILQHLAVGLDAVRQRIGAA